MSEAGFLLDVNVLIALTDEEHQQHPVATNWFVHQRQGRWATCVLTQAGFIRIKSNPRAGGQSVEEVTEALRLFTSHPEHRFWATTPDWMNVAAHFGDRIFGHQQVTDAYLLGHAVEESGVLVTMDKGIRYLAGERYLRNLLVIEQSMRM